MNYQNKILLRSLIVLMLLIGALYWVLAGNRGVLHIAGVEGPYSLVVREFRVFQCEQDECQFSLPMGKQTVCITKSGYYELCTELPIPWRRTLRFAPVLERIPTLVEDTTLFSIEPNIEIIRRDPLRILTDQGNEYFYDFIAGQLYKGTPGDEQDDALVAAFYQLENIRLAALGENIIVHTDQEVFLIDTGMNARQRIFTGESVQVKALDANTLAISDTERLVLFSPSTGRLTSLPFQTPVEWLALCTEDTLSFAAYTKTDTNIRFATFLIDSGIEREIMTAKVNDPYFSLQCVYEPNALGLTFEDGKRFLLRY